MSVVEIDGVRTTISNEFAVEVLFTQYAELKRQAKELENKLKVITAQQDQIKASLRNTLNEKDPETHLKGRLMTSAGDILRIVKIQSQWEKIVKDNLPEFYKQLNTNDFPQYYTQSSEYRVNV